MWIRARRRTGRPDAADATARRGERTPTRGWRPRAPRGTLGARSASCREGCPVTRSSVATTGFAVLVLATALVAVTPSFAATAPTPNVSFRNSRPLMPLDLYRSFLTSQALCRACRRSRPASSRRPASPPQPTRPRRRQRHRGARVRAEGRRSEGVARHEAACKNAFLKTVVGAERLAAAGDLRGSGKGALAALLVAAGSSPRDPLPLIDAAALLIDAKKPNEALALLAQAAKLPQRKLRPSSGVPTLARPGDQPLRGATSAPASTPPPSPLAGARSARAPGWSRRARTSAWRCSARAG